MFHAPENYRITRHPVPRMNSDASYGNNGCFWIRLSGEVLAWIIVSDGEGWEHVSVHISDEKLGKNKNGTVKERTPTWSEMCKIKDIFWDEEDCVIQYHPPKSTYVNNHNFTLHLWKPTNVVLPMPDSILVGFVE